jgi:hypothetical protein
MQKNRVAIFIASRDSAHCFSHNIIFTIGVCCKSLQTDIVTLEYENKLAMFLTSHISTLTTLLYKKGNCVAARFASEFSYV